MPKQKMIGAYVPEEYEQEILDKLHKNFPRTPMTQLVRALLGMWFEGRVPLKRADLKQYHRDARKYTVRRQPRPAGIEGEGYDAAASGTPVLANPYIYTMSASGQAEVDYDKPDAQAWTSGWHKYFSQGD